jgi:3-oxoacyl-[acyl-carrier protein] reductase
VIDPGLKDKIVLITGGNHGIGAATARAFARQEAHIFITYYREPTDLSESELRRLRQEAPGGPEQYLGMQQQPVEPLLEELTALGVRCAAWEADLGQAENIPALFDRCQAALGPVDVLVNNHTFDILETFDPERVTGHGFPVSLVSAQVIDAHFAVNARAYALLMKEYTLRHLERGKHAGCIINLSTDAAHAHPENVSYAASKHAIESYTRSAAAELGKYGIRVNVIAPGPIQTGYITPQSAVEITRGTPLGRVGRPEDVAEVVVFLASDQAHWLTGQLLYVGGGWRMGQ